MQRKNFIQSILPLTALLTQSTGTLAQQTAIPTKPLTIPNYLQPGDCIGITCPAGYLTLDEVQPAVSKLTEWGYTIQLGSTVGTRYGSFAATDAERQQDLQAMLNSTTIKAILCGRGGYGCNRIIDGLSFTAFAKYPKWLIGFSDITLLHSHIHTQYNIATLHSKMCNSFLADWTKAEPAQLLSIESIHKALQGNTPMQYQCNAHASNKLGTATGVLVGGNLSILCSAIGTSSQLHTSGAILFLEEVGEYLYSIDRMLRTMQRSGALAHIKALIIGGFKHKPSEKPEEEFNETVVDIVLNITKEYNYPICFNFMVGHQKANDALKCGVPHTLLVSKQYVTLTEQLHTPKKKKNKL